MKLYGKKIKYVTEVRYLGLTIDHKLSWKPHIKKVLDSGCSLMRALASKTRGLYGPKPKLMKWTYTGIVRPKITYGCIWSEWRLTVIAAAVRIALVDILDLSEVDIPAGVFLHPAVGWG